MLNEQQVLEIYMAKLALQAQRREDAPDTNNKGQSVRYSVMYGVTSRAIRDIWNRQSWAYATRHLWHLEPQLGVDTATSFSEVLVMLHNFYNLMCTLDGAVDSCELRHSKISHQDTAVLDGRRDLVTGFRENQIQNTISRSSTLSHLRIMNGAKLQNYPATKGFLPTGK
jgi:hypothetical protein